MGAEESGPHRPTALVEGIRLAVVVLATMVGFEVAAAGLLPPPLDIDGLVVVPVLLGAATGYVVGGVVGRVLSRSVDRAEQQLRTVPAARMLTGVLGGLVGLAVGLALVWPLALVGEWRYMLPLGAVALMATVVLGARIGAGRSGDLLRLLGAGGRLAVASPSTGHRAKVVDTSALIDGRVLPLCRSGFLDGTLVIARVVLGELQRLADSAEDHRRRRGQRGLDVLAGLQRAGVGVEITDHDYPEIAEVDAKLVAMADERDAPLLTCDGNLARVAEVQGVTVLNLHRLAEDLRPPVLPGEALSVRVIKPGKEAGQGVGYLDDGTMVVVEGARERQGETVDAEVTSVLSTGHGRLVFAGSGPAPGGHGGRASGPRPVGESASA